MYIYIYIAYKFVRESPSIPLFKDRFVLEHFKKVYTFSAVK